MKPRDLGRVLRTVRHLRPAQIVGQLARPLRGEPRPVPASGPARLRIRAAASPFLALAAHARASTARRVALLNRTLDVGAPLDWETLAHGPLFRFHLHYHDWLRAPGIAPAERSAVLRDWLERHRAGVGWHPATISLRAFVWTKLLLTQDALPNDGALADALVASLADQLATLAAHPERDLLANHYLFNLLALVLGGVVLEGAAADRALRFEGALRGELAEQILPDGAHYERSPMYHALVLEAVLDVLGVAAAAPGRLALATETSLRAAAARMLGAHAVWTHPDGEIALFGDSAFGIAPRPDELAAYARRLGVEPAQPAAAGFLPDAGFARLAAGPFTLLATAAAPMPPYQPGHAHCDALSFELSVGRERVVTDAGVYEYVPGVRRDASRATGSHATIQVRGEEQAELWGAHRVGGRPRVAWAEAAAPRAAEATCRGWASLEVEARRRFELSEDVLRITDRVEPEQLVTVRLPLAPELQPRLLGHGAQIGLRSGRTLSLELPETLAWRVEMQRYFPEFGREIERACITGEGRIGKLRWSFRLEGA